MNTDKSQQPASHPSVEDRYGLGPLLNRSLEGDSLAFNDLMGKLRHLVRMRVYERLGPNLVYNDGSDLVQNACLRICGHFFGQFRGPGPRELIGWVKVITDNVGPTGNLNLLYPTELPATSRPSLVDAHRPLHIVDVELTPPTGRERLVALWSRQPLPLPLPELLSLAERDQVQVSQPYRATRDMVHMQESVQRLQPDDWKAVVLELNHLSPVEDA
jgi:hypothetical protein